MFSRYEQNEKKNFKCSHKIRTVAPVNFVHRLAHKLNREDYFKDFKIILRNLSFIFRTFVWLLVLFNDNEWYLLIGT